VLFEIRIQSFDGRPTLAHLSLRFRGFHALFESVDQFFMLAATDGSASLSRRALGLSRAGLAMLLGALIHVQGDPARTGTLMFARSLGFEAVALGAIVCRFVSLPGEHLLGDMAWGLGFCGRIVIGLPRSDQGHLPQVRDRQMFAAGIAGVGNDFL
jgi:hypothetical protein